MVEVEDYVRLAAVTMHARLTRQVGLALPGLSAAQHDAVILGIIERLARMRGARLARGDARSELARYYAERGVELPCNVKEGD